LTALDQIIHLLNFCAPAVFVGLLLALLGPMLRKNSARRFGLGLQTAFNGVAGTLALGAGLWVFGVDGKMASYAALILASASTQWLGSRS
jgi:hypothetical protein